MRDKRGINEKKKSFILKIVAGMCSGGGKSVFREKSSNFSLDFLASGPLVRIGPRSKVVIRSKGYAWAPFWGVLTTPGAPTCFNPFLRALLMLWWVLGRERLFGWSRNVGLKCWKFGTVLGSPETDYELILVNVL